MPMIGKRLHVADSLEKLFDMATVDKKSIATQSTERLCNSAKKLLTEAKKNSDMNDEEMAFVYYYKFLDLAMYLKGKSDFVGISSSTYLRDSLVPAMVAAEKLKDSLSQRYAALNASKEKKVNDENENVPQIANLKTETVTDSSSKMGDAKHVGDLVIDTTPVHSITASALYLLMTDQKSSFLILDVRSKAEFEESHIKHPSCLNVPREVLVPGMTCSQLVQQIPLATVQKWSEKNTVDHVIILDWDTSETCLPANHPIYTLEEAMVRWDNKTPLRKSPLILIGGYKEWLLRYPMYTTKALDVLSLEKPRFSTPVADVASVDYPDLDAALVEEIGPVTVLNNKSRFSSSKGKVVNGWVNEPDHGTKPQPLVNRFVKPNIPSNAAFVASHSVDSSEERLSIANKKDVISSPKNQVPGFNRSLKPSWNVKSNNMADALKNEAIAAKETLNTVQEQLNKEKEFTQLRLRKELEAEESKRIELQKQELRLFESIRALEKEKLEHEKQYLALKEENLKMKKLLEAHSTEEQKEKMKEIQSMETKKEDLMKEVERLRQERKLREQKEAAVRPNTSPSMTTSQENAKNLVQDNSKEQVKYQPECYSEALKDAPESPSRGLTRSYSSPNIAQMFAEQDLSQPKKRTPTVDRSLKPKFECRPSYEELTVLRMRNLNPTYGCNHDRPATGLRNLGNTCYMNSIIQCLSNTIQLANYFNLDKYKNHIRRNSKHGTNGEIVFEFAFIIKSLWAGQYKSFSPKDFKNTASKYIPMCKGYEQQDSHEFLVVLMDKLHADLNQGCSTEPLPNLDSVSVSQATDAFWHHHTMKNRSKISETFEGLLRSTLTCLSCRKTSNSYEVFSCLSLPISSTQCTLKDSLTTFLKPEKMSGEGAWECPNCRRKKEAEKILVFSKLPDVLVIQLKRFSYEGMWRRKIQALVKFPYTIELSSECNPSRTYHLYGIVNHFGYLEGGHYTAYCKTPESCKWYKYDDHEVSENPPDIVSPAAYLLFYTVQGPRKL